MDAPSGVSLALAALHSRRRTTEISFRSLKCRKFSLPLYSFLNWEESVSALCKTMLCQVRFHGSGLVYNTAFKTRKLTLFFYLKRGEIRDARTTPRYTTRSQFLRFTGVTYGTIIKNKISLNWVKNMNSVDYLMVNPCDVDETCNNAFSQGVPKRSGLLWLSLKQL